MPRIFGRFFGKGDGLAHARAAELRGDLAHAAVLFAQAGRPDEAARVMVLRGDVEADPATRLRHYLQAMSAAPAGSGAQAHATRKRAAAVLALCEEVPLTRALRHDVTDAAKALEAVGDHSLAADAYARIEDIEGQVRALTRAGEIERLDAVLAEEHGRDRARIARRQAHDEIDALTASGLRREAAALARGSDDDDLRRRGLDLEGLRIAGGAVRAVLRGKRLTIALGDEVVVGRQPETARGRGAIAVASAAVSRTHVAIRRRGGAVVVTDLGSRNGTRLRGLAVGGDVAVEGGVELHLGGEVPLVVRPSADLANAVDVEIGGGRWVAPLGPARLGIGQWQLERAEDDWIELVTGGDPPAFSGPMLLAPRVTLAAGDVFAVERRGAAALEILGGDRDDRDRGQRGERG
jgi:hypothetical protein